MTRKHLAAVAAAALIIAACSAGETQDTTASSSGISLGTIGAADADTPASTTPESGVTAPTAPTSVSVASVTPALGITGSASDSFDAAGLVEGPGSGFVPMDNPVMVPASDVTWLNDDSVVMGVVHSSGESQAYPVGQMAYHHIANTTVAGEPFLVTY